jgi:transposase
MAGREADRKAIRCGFVCGFRTIVVRIFIAIYARLSPLDSAGSRCADLKNITDIYGRKIMLSVTNDTPIYIYTGRMDFRKSINGLVNVLAESFAKNPQQGGLYVFSNRQRNKLKILFWDKNGFVLYYKRLEKSRFQYSKYLQGDEIVVNPAQLKALLMGLDFYLLGEYPRENYQEFF